MQIYGGMGCRTLERFVKGMREMKGYTNTRFFRWKKSCHHLNMSP
jgi:hypothetical protein